MFFWRKSGHKIGDEDLSAYLDGRLTEADRERLEAHVESCAACRDALDELRALRLSLQHLPRARAPRSFALSQADVRRPPARQPFVTQGRTLTALAMVALAASVAFGALVGIEVRSQRAESRATLVTAGGAAAVPKTPPPAEARTTGPTPGPLFAAETEKKTQATEDSARERGIRLPTAPVLQATPACGAGASCAGEPTVGTAQAAVPESAAAGVTAIEPEAPAGSSRFTLRLAEATTAAVALLSATSLVLLWRRRT